MAYPIYDLHCDLLYYVAADPTHSALNPESRCSLTQLKGGGVASQTLAIFVSTKKGSAECGAKQFEIYLNLPNKYHAFCSHAKTAEKDTIALSYAIENASALCEEHEPISSLFSRFETMIKKAGPPIYLSLTWNEENRFGGGNQTHIGLKPDGEALLEYLSFHRIAIDLSHTSDPLAADILDYIDQKALNCTPIASHSNFRSVVDVARNLPDEIAKEIAKRGGVIGLNFVRRFLGSSFEGILKQIQKANELKIENSLTFGADFFSDLPSLTNLLQSVYPFFHKGYDNASCFPRVLELLSEEVPGALVKKIAYQNLVEFLQRQKGARI